MSSKRLQTGDNHASNLAANVPASLSPAVSSDLTNALRNIGMRTRKSVLEGYAMNSNLRAVQPWTKAMSTGTLNFQSSHHAMDTQGSSQPIPSRKRHRSASPVADTDDPNTVDVNPHLERPVKPLRRSGRMLQSQSLPAGALFSNHSKANEEEEDWSSELDVFEPMSLS